MEDPAADPGYLTGALSELTLNGSWITSEVVAAVARNISSVPNPPRLRSLCLWLCSNADDVSLVAMARACPGLAVLHLQELPHVRPVSLWCGVHR